jgi:WD40 repeat protein
VTGSGYVSDNGTVRRGEVNIWDLKSERSVFASTDQPSPIHCVAVSHDSRLMASGAGDWGRMMPGEVRLWSVPDGASRGRFTPHSEGTLALAFHPKGLQLATGGWDGSVKLWDATRLMDDSATEPAATLAGVGKVNCLAFTSAGDRLAAGHSDGRIFVWNLNAKPPSSTELRRISGWIARLEFSPDDSTLAAATGMLETENSQVGLIELASRRLTLLKHPGDRHVLGLAFIDGGRSLVTGAEDGQLRVWEVASAKESQALRHEGTLRALAPSHKGTTFATVGGWDSAIRLWSRK